jgi:hypothetical protein
MVEVAELIEMEWLGTLGGDGGSDSAAGGMVG